MIIVMNAGAREEEILEVCQRVTDLGYSPHRIDGVERTVVACVGHEDKTPLNTLETMNGVDAVIPILRPFKLVSRDVKTEKTVITVGDVKIGGPEITIIAGPCSVESEEQIVGLAQLVRSQGGQFLRGGAFKPRTSPYSFQGLKEEGLKMLRKAADETGLKVVTEIVSPSDIDIICKYADMIQIGARNVQNYALLRSAGASGKPVLLKRGMATTIEEYLMAAEYLFSEGNYNVVLCERGIRTFETSTRFTLDLSMVPVVRQLSHLPILVDPSHAAGQWKFVSPLAKAALAVGADGLVIEVHPNPATAWSDGAQSLLPKRFVELMDEVRRMAPVLDRVGPRKITD